MLVIPTELIRDKTLTNTECCILGMIYNCNCMQCYLPQENIRKKLGFSFKSISASLQKLCDMGFINYIAVANKRYKLIEPTDKFFKYFKKRANIKASYKEYRPTKIKFKKKVYIKELTPELMEEGKRLMKELIGKECE